MDIRPIITLHGIFMNVLGLGTLITGPSGIGKSELGLTLVSHGHLLIADDIVEAYLDGNQQLIGRCPTMLQDFIEVRGLGVLNIRKMFGETAVKSQQPMDLIVELVEDNSKALINSDRLHDCQKLQNILGIEVPMVSLPVTAGRQLSVLIECAVRDRLLQRNGYNANDDFAARQKIAMKEEKK